MSKSIAWAVVCLVVVVGFVACGGGGGSSDSSSNGSTSLVGTWYASTVDGNAVSKPNHNYMIYSASTYSTLWGVTTTADCLDYGTYSNTSSSITCTPVHSDCSSGTTAYSMSYTLSGNNLTISANGHAVVYVKQ